MIAVENLWKRYRGATALGGISLTVEKGRVLGILGENGSGKSTLFKILAGVAHASEGQVTISGQPVGVETRRITSYLPETNPFYDWMGVIEQLEFLASFYPGWDMAKSRQLLDLMNIDSDRKVGTLSDGQRARLKVVAAFSRSSQLVLMDEPLGRIDPPSRKRILQILLNEFRFGEQTILISTHLVSEVEELIEDVTFLRSGEIALSGNAEELRQNRGMSLSDIFEEVVE
jgi:ABC-2 type transport system ATP-binding protein